MKRCAAAERMQQEEDHENTQEAKPATNSGCGHAEVEPEEYACAVADKMQYACAVADKIQCKQNGWK